MPGLSRDPRKRARQLANLRSYPSAPSGNQRALIHGGRSELLVRDVEAEVRELMDALGDAAPVRDADGSLPTADVVAVERAARALKRYRHLNAWCDLHGRVVERTGDVKPAAEYELKAERELAAALDVLGMNPTSRARLGVDLVRGHDALADFLAERERREAIDTTGEDDDGPA